MTGAGPGPVAAAPADRAVSPPLARPTLVTLVTGGRAGTREDRIAAELESGGVGRTAIILEGLADARSGLATHAAHATDGADGVVTIARIAPGCLCCTGNLVLRVTLNRLLRRPPARLFISLADARHLATLKAWLSAAPYQSLLSLGPDIDLPAQD